jgi:hypothetical protein
VLRVCGLALNVRQHEINCVGHQCHSGQLLVIVGNFASKLRVSRTLSASAIASPASKERAASSQRLQVFLPHTGSLAKPRSTSVPVIKVPSSGSGSVQCAEQQSSIPRRARWTVSAWLLGHSPIPTFQHLFTQSTIAGDIPGSSYHRGQLPSKGIQHEQRDLSRCARLKVLPNPAASLLRSQNSYVSLFAAVEEQTCC